MGHLSRAGLARESGKSLYEIDRLLASGLPQLHRLDQLGVSQQRPLERLHDRPQVLVLDHGCCSSRHTRGRTGGEVDIAA
jgi:hypothetical protein